MILPAGFAVHCESCGIAVPSDAPRPASGTDCAWVVRNKMAQWHGNETLKGQHTAATAAWKLIHHAAVEGPTPDAASVAYWQQYRKDPKKHFTASAARAALTPEQLAAETGKVPLAQTPPTTAREFRAWKVQALRLTKVRRDAAFYK